MVDDKDDGGWNRGGGVVESGGDGIGTGFALEVEKGGGGGEGGGGYGERICGCKKEPSNISARDDRD